MRDATDNHPYPVLETRHCRVFCFPVADEACPCRRGYCVGALREREGFRQKNRGRGPLLQGLLLTRWRHLQLSLLRRS